MGQSRWCVSKSQTIGRAVRPPETILQTETPCQNVQCPLTELMWGKAPPDVGQSARGWRYAPTEKALCPILWGKEAEIKKKRFPLLCLKGSVSS